MKKDSRLAGALCPESRAEIRAIVMAVAQFVRPCEPRDVLKAAGIDRETAVAAGCLDIDIEALDDHDQWPKEREPVDHDGFASGEEDGNEEQSR